MNELVDGEGRRFSYLRLSVTDVCNYHCQYCLPDGYRKAAGPGFLAADEIERLVSGLAGLGLWKIRLTGGEPTVRRDFAEIIARVSAVPGIRRVAATTNGYRLAEKAQLWRQAGLDAINVSIDSLDRANFARITGHDHLPRVLDGIAAAEAAGFSAIKVNSVLLRDINDHEFDLFLDWIRDRRISLRFIELMETGDNAEYFRAHHLPAGEIVRRLQARGWQPVARPEGAGPAQEYAHAGSLGRIGIIAPYGKDFCASCNRLRVTARGQLRLCLFGDGGHDLRPLLQEDSQRGALQRAVRGLLEHKPAGHQLHFHRTGATPHLASLGG